MTIQQPVYVAGHNGMVGSAVVRKLRASDIEDILVRSRQELDLCNQQAVSSFFQEHRPKTVVFAAARVGGIHANNTRPAEFIYQNLAMATHAIHAAWQNQVSRFLFLGSTCIYPKQAPQPMPESSLLAGPLEVTNEAYAIAKIAGLKMCQHYRQQYDVMFHSAMPTNLYGPGDNYHPKNSHVLPALLRRFHEAKVANAADVVIWGSGKPKREFLHVDDLANAVLHLLQLPDPPDWVNVGTGTEISILELAKLISDITGFRGSIHHDTSQPDGTMLKRTDTTLINNTGWSPTIPLQQGIERTYEEFLEALSQAELREV